MRKTIFITIIAIIFVPVWIWSIYVFEDFRIFSIFIPPLLVVNFSKNKSLRNMVITILVIAWMGLFQYESVRYFYLNRLTAQELPKTKFLFPPAGWIMFYNVDDQFGFSEVYGVKGKQVQFIDPHDIFRTRTIGYDNIHRGILGSATRKELGYPFCKYLKRRFDHFDNFFVKINYYPEMSAEPFKRYEQIQYYCFEGG